MSIFCLFFVSNQISQSFQAACNKNTYASHRPQWGSELDAAATTNHNNDNHNNFNISYHTIKFIVNPKIQNPHNMSNVICRTIMIRRRC